MWCGWRTRWRRRKRCAAGFAPPPPVRAWLRSCVGAVLRVIATTGCRCDDRCGAGGQSSVVAVVSRSRLAPLLQGLRRVSNPTGCANTTTHHDSVIPAKAGIHFDLVVAFALRSPRRNELATGKRRPEGRRAGRAPCATQAMDGLCGASLRTHRTIVALDSKTRKAPFFGYFLWQDKESDPAACGRKLWIAACPHSPFE